MNKIYRLIFNRRTGRIAVVAETVNSQGAGSSPGTASALVSAVSFIGTLSPVMVAVALALGGQAAMADTVSGTNEYGSGSVNPGTASYVTLFGVGAGTGDPATNTDNTGFGYYSSSQVAGNYNSGSGAYSSYNVTGSYNTGLGTSSSYQVTGNNNNTGSGTTDLAPVSRIP